jgi:hypothetical protein
LIPPGPNPFGGSSYVAGEQAPEGQQNPYGVAGFSSDYQKNQGQINEEVAEDESEDESEEQRMARLMGMWDSEIGDVVDEMLEAAQGNGNSHH